MKRFTEKPFFQKFKKERRHETTTTTRTTTTTEYKKFSSSHREEFSSSSEQHEEQLYGENENGKPKSLRFTQSLQDAFHPNLMDDHQHQHLLQLSNEFPPLQREPRQYQPRNIREEQKEFSEQFEDDKFVRSHQQKLFEFREQFNLNGENGGGQCQPQKMTMGEGDQAVPETQPKEEEEQQQQRQYSRTMAMKRTTERQQQFVERRWQHSSMPPLERLRLMQAQQQMPHELVLDRFPPQLVQSVHQLADAAERRHERSSNSRGFSPFPVFGPFITDSTSGSAGATMAPQPRQKSVPPQATYDGTKRWARAPPREEMSVSMTTSQHRMPIFDKLPKQQHQSTNLLPPPMTSSSGDEWQSAYECLPHWTKQMPKTPPATAPKSQQYLSSSFPSFCAAPFAESVQCSVNLCKFHAYSRQLAAKSIWPMSDSQAEMFQSVVSVEGNQRIGPILNESATFSEHQANDEVRNLMGASGTVSPPAQMHTTPEIQNQQSTVRVEFSGPVNFLHATNLNVTNNRNIYNSMSESGEKKNEIGKNRSERRDKMTISPPVERYIDSVCDLGPIFTEIGQSLRAQNHKSSFVLTPTGNIRRAEQQKREMAQHSKENAEAPEKNEAFACQIDTIEQRQNMTKGRKASLQHINVPYLVNSSSQCNFSRVSDVTQEWRLARVPSEESVEFAAMETIRSQTCRVTEAFSGTFNSANKMPIGRLQNVPRGPSVDNFCYSSASACQNATANATVSHRTKSQPSRYGPTPSMHRTQSADRAALETAQWWRRQDDAQNALRDTLTDVQREQAAARAYSKRFHCAEAERIERAILAISEGLSRPMVIGLKRYN
ncbi:hypothetical protein niasHT_038954 [Heterodera trifolii]|uniref:Uncharacterized protein n=1 Tax=Heterodera trifolii TaxID=157864 RepID=A0ABD2I3D8_9BILA